MFAVVRKLFLASVLVMTVFATGAWQSSPAALAQSQDPGIPEAPLYPGLTWSAPEPSAQALRVGVNDFTVSLAGERYAAQEQFAEVLPEHVLNYYSNEQMAALGWASYDVVDGEDGFRYIFSHASGVYLSVEFLACPADPTSYCVGVWKSEPVDALPAAPEVEAPAPFATFSKTSPSNGASNISPSSVTLTWEAASPTPDKYSYCVKAGSECADNDPNWTSNLDRSVTVTNLAANTTYYWQVRSTTCEECVQKPWVYANDDKWWTFKTNTLNQVTILGNVGIDRAVLSYTDGSAKTVTADSTGAYSLKVSNNWTGTITPSKAGYIFTPPNASFTNLTAAQTIQNFNATPVFTISGNTGTPGVTLSYTDGTPKTVVSDANGNYAFSVLRGWSGTVTPTKTSYSFTPPNRTYANVQASQTAQNYTATFITYNISGNTGTGGVTLIYGDNQFAMSDSNGNYSITVPQSWTGSVKPYKVGTSFNPGSRNYTNVQAHAAAQNYTASNCPSCADGETTGVFRPSNGLLYLKNLNITGFADVSINYGIGGDYPVVGDWDGDGDATIGVYRNGLFYLRNSNTVGFADIVFAFGAPGDQPVAGDWDNDGIDTIGVYRAGTFYLRNSNTSGSPDEIFGLGVPGDVGIAGDWNGDGFDTTGVFRPSNGALYLKNSNTTGVADVTINYGIAGDKPVTGDWDNNGTDTIGVYRNGIFYLRNSNTVGFADIVFALGVAGDHPIAGDWDARP